MKKAAPWGAALTPIDPGGDDQCFTSAQTLRFTA